MTILLLQLTQISNMKVIGFMVMVKLWKGYPLFAYSRFAYFRSKSGVSSTLKKLIATIFLRLGETPLFDQK